MKKSELANLRKLAGLSQENLARLLDVSVTTVWRWENGVVAIPGPVALALRSILSSPAG